jgi:hypothetical protein
VAAMRTVLVCGLVVKAQETMHHKDYPTLLKTALTCHYNRHKLLESVL